MSFRTVLSASLPALSLLLVACGGSDDDGESSSPGATTDGTGGAGGDGAGGGGGGGGGGAGPSEADPCGLGTNFPGDEFCLLPPDPDEGIQLHMGPPSYDDPDALAPWLMAAGEFDNVRCYNVRVPDGDFYYFKQQNNMRAGSHHMLIPLMDAATETEGPTDCGSLGSLGALPGSQTPVHKMPAGELAPEDQGLARFLPANAMASFQMHYVNTNGDEAVLREAWVNIYRKPEAEVTDRVQGIFLVGDLSVNVLPGTRSTSHLEFTPALTEPTRVFTLAGHSHANAETFTVWRTRGESRELIYKSFDWAEPIELTLNTVVKNPLPDDVSKRDGGVSGLFFLEPGDKIEWECEVNNRTDAALRFANEAYTAEMCLLAGGYVSDTAGLMR
ncbi:MAG: hypothetical protein FJ104_05865, partial [Deltaproteobacteria bacterium]|nr:hypothetical protein [Deltaproteobacteria bacterium]